MQVRSVQPVRLQDVRLEVRKIDGEPWCQLTQPAETSFRDIVTVMNDKSQKKWGRDVVFRGMLLKDLGMDRTFPEKVVHTFAPRVTDSNNKNKQPEQEEVLGKRWLNFTDRPILTVAGGKYRLDKDGFPESGVGTSTDPGDLFQGMVTRARSGAVGSYAHGVYAYCFNSDADADGADALVFAAGSPKLGKA